MSPHPPCWEVLLKWVIGGEEGGVCAELAPFILCCYLFKGYFFLRQPGGRKEGGKKSPRLWCNHHSQMLS